MTCCSVSFSICWWDYGEIWRGMDFKHYLQFYIYKSKAKGKTVVLSSATDTIRYQNKQNYGQETIQFCSDCLFVWFFVFLFVCLFFVLFCFFLKYTYYVIIRKSICDAIKQNESEVANAVFKIQANKADSFFCFLLFLQSFNCLYL